MIHILIIMLLIMIYLSSYQLRIKVLSSVGLIFYALHFSFNYIIFNPTFIVSAIVIAFAIYFLRTFFSKSNKEV